MLFDYKKHDKTPNPTVKITSVRSIQLTVFSRRCSASVDRRVRIYLRTASSNRRSRHTNTNYNTEKRGRRAKKLKTTYRYPTTTTTTTVKTDTGLFRARRRAVGGTYYAMVTNVGRNETKGRRFFSHPQSARD